MAWMFSHANEIESYSRAAASSGEDAQEWGHPDDTETSANYAGEALT